MKLYYSKTSPYARKVRMILIEKNMYDQVELIEINPFDKSEEFLQLNALGKIPVLITDAGQSIIDSPVICQYLDELPNTLSKEISNMSSNKLPHDLSNKQSDENRLIPLDNDQKWNVLKWQALSDGLADATYSIVMERRRKKGTVSTLCIQNWVDEMESVLQQFENSVSELKSKVTLGHLAVAAAMGYIDLRMPNILYQAACPQVANYPGIIQWYESFKTRECMCLTHPNL